MAEEYSPDCGHFNQFKKDCCVIYKLGFKDEKAITVAKRLFSLSLNIVKCGWLELGAYLAECISVELFLYIKMPQRFY